MAKWGSNVRLEGLSIFYDNARKSFKNQSFGKFILNACLISETIVDDPIKSLGINHCEGFKMSDCMLDC